ncbi:MAG: beta-lactamase family protein [Myxococcales bacterium]|nr:beta-lactamase family protein [Myxococcales bacterium]
MNPAPDLDPTRRWPTSSPEEQGVSSTVLVAMMEHLARVQRRRPSALVDSITVVRHGHVVADLYPTPHFPPHTKHVIHSCTKSIVSSLVGIALQQGLIDSVHAPVLPLLGRSDSGPLSRLTLQHLLTMQTGLRSRDSFLYGWHGLFEMMRTDAWTSHILALPSDASPGARFDYSNMSSYLLSAVLAHTTGTDVLTFARRHLFDPLGIEDVRWERSPEGIHIGWARMWLRPHDMAKVGQLYLDQGRWQGRQVVPRDWVRASTTRHARPRRYVYVRDADGRPDYLASGGSWMFANLVRPFSQGYGYQWWLGKRGVYTALGVNGQYIMVAPRHDLVAVFTSKLTGTDVFLPARLLFRFVLPAIQSRSALPEAPDAHATLTRLGTPQAQPAATPVQTLPPDAERVSEVLFRTTDNPWQYDSFQLIFDPGNTEAYLSYTKRDVAIRHAVGLDGRHRATQIDGQTYLARGRWTTPHTFSVEHQIVGDSSLGRWTFTTSGSTLRIEEHGVTGTHVYQGHPLPRGDR